LGERLAGALRGVHLAALAVWLGGAVTLIAFVAPGAFEVLGSRAGAGRMVGHVLDRLDLLAILATPVLVATAFHDERTRGNPTALWVRISILVALGAEAGVSRFALSPRLAALRPEVPASPDAPWLHRAEFQTLHGISMALLVFGVLCAAAALYFAARRHPLADVLQTERASGD
jgi:hypothetical protein